MKHLLSKLAVAVIIGTSISSLKPVFMSNVVNHGFKSNQDINKFWNQKTQQDTIYIDKNGKQQTTSPYDLSNINSKKMCKLDWWKL